jgi:hypothetical protein
MKYNYLETAEGSHSGLVRAPAKRLPWVTGVEGSNPSPSAITIMLFLIIEAPLNVNYNHKYQTSDTSIPTVVPLKRGIHITP